MALWLCLAVNSGLAQAPPELLEPMVGTPGKDVVYVPQPADVVDRMLDAAKVTPEDFVIDLGSGDGRNVIAAAKRGARALGVEYNAEFVEYSRRVAAAAGVADKASFVQGDMYEADISQATVLALFLLSENLRKLKPKFLDLKPGTRIVINTFKIDGWQPDETVRAHDQCTLWCDLQVYIVPARVEGVWHMAGGELRLQQDHQILAGTLIQDGKSAVIEQGRLRGEQISFTAGGTHYVGRVQDSRIEGSSLGLTQGNWSARRAGS